MGRWPAGLIAIYEVSRALIDYIFYIGNHLPDGDKEKSPKRLDRIDEDAEEAYEEESSH